MDRVIEHYLASDQRATRILPKPARASNIGDGMVTAPASERTNLQNWGGLLPSEVVLLTFTNRAAEEMKDRLRRTISRIRPGPLGDDGENRYDPRIKSQGFMEQLLTLLEDAPIGTIDSFLSQLVSPYRGKLGNAASKENISDSARTIMIEKALKTIWRLPKATSKIGDAVDVGIPAQIASDVLSARDRVAQHYSGRTSASRVLRSLVGKSVFVEESSRKIMDENGEVDRNRLLEMIMSSIEDTQINEQADRVVTIVGDIFDTIKQCIQTPSSSGWAPQTRMACLEELVRTGPPTDPWEKLCWMGHMLTCTVSPSSLMTKEMKHFPGLKLPSDEWDAGVRSYAQIKDANLKALYKTNVGEKTTELSSIWSDELGNIVLHFVRIAILLGESKPPQVPSTWSKPTVKLPVELPASLEKPNKTHHFSLEAEIQNITDLHLLHLGFQGVLKNLKMRDEVHDFDDIQRLAGDLLLANCPEVCRTFYHPSVQQALDSIDQERPWRDDHVDRALEAVSVLEENRDLAGEAASRLAAMRTDIESRQLLLGQIRRRFRAFIIDEAQDNSPLQWRLLSRLWGPRELRDDDAPRPDTPWEPTVCYVGDVKQSIYAFRQAEVTGFLDFAKSLRAVNVHEFSSISELTRKPSLRRETHSRDPRNDHHSSIARATEYMERGGRDLVPWIPFDATDWDLPAPTVEEVKARREGMISLNVNYRTSGGLLGAMNEWWSDIFSERHRTFPNANFYASPQTLHSFPEKKDIPGSIEWICPPDSDNSSDPPTDLEMHLDPFGPGNTDPLERQATLIAMRVRSLIEGSPVRVRSSSGDWEAAESSEPVRPTDITILLPNRVNLRDVIVRNLQDLEVPYQVDREGSLMERPAASALEGLIQFVARPHSRYYATWVARSPLIGMSDGQLQRYLSSADNGEDLLSLMISHCDSERQRSLVSRWRELSSSSLLGELLQDTIDRSDLLVALPDEVSRQDSEQFCDLFSELSDQVGGDPIVLADRLRDLRENPSQSIEASTVSQGDAVKVMTIHSSKGLEAKVVVLADLFSSRQTNMRNEQNSRLIVGPEMYAGHPKPWPLGKTPISALWEHASLLHRARKNAEARRLLYVAATRAEERLIIAGSPTGTAWTEGEGITFPWTYDKSAPQLGQMWLESLRAGSLRRAEEGSPWLGQTDTESKPAHQSRGNTTLCPAKIVIDGHLGFRKKTGLTILHHPDCFIDTVTGGNQITTPLQRIRIIDESSRSVPTHDTEYPPPKPIRYSTTVKANPSKLPSYYDCPRCHWMELRAGLESTGAVKNDEAMVHPEHILSVDSATFGTVFHRIVEIGIGNPGPTQNGPTTPLPRSWTTPTEDKINDKDTHQTAFKELLPPGADLSRVSEAISIMARRVSEGKLGSMVRGQEVDGRKVEGLRTEMPFQISIPIQFEPVTRGKWTPDGEEVLISFDSTKVELSGIIDLVLCTSNDDGVPAIRAIDLKTTDASSILGDWESGLLDSLGDDSIGPSCQAEENLLHKHRLQMALYHMALEESESDKEREGLPSRRVLPPAILVGVSGRLVEYPSEDLDKAKLDLDKTLALTARMSLASEFPLSEVEKDYEDRISKCKKCSIPEEIESKSP